MQNREGLALCPNKISSLEPLFLFAGDLPIRETTENSTPPLQEILVFLLHTNPQASTIPCPQQNGKGWNQLDWAQPSANPSDTGGEVAPHTLSCGMTMVSNTGDPKPKA